MNRILKTLAGLFSRYAQKVSVSIAGDVIRTQAFIQPVRYKNKFYLGFEVDRAGIKNSSCYLYIGLPEPDVASFAAVTRITYGGREYFIKRAEKIYIGDEPVYIWAILMPVIRNGGNGNSVIVD